MWVEAGRRLAVWGLRSKLTASDAQWASSCQLRLPGGGLWRCGSRQVAVDLTI